MQRTAGELREMLVKLLPQEVPDDVRRDYELVIEPSDDNYWDYYFADRVRKRIVWVHEIGLEIVTGHAVRSVPSNSHLGLLFSFRAYRKMLTLFVLALELEAQFW